MNPKDHLSTKKAIQRQLPKSASPARHRTTTGLTTGLTAARSTMDNTLSVAPTQTPLTSTKTPKIVKNGQNGTMTRILAKTTKIVSHRQEKLIRNLNTPNFSSKQVQELIIKKYKLVNFARKIRDWTALYAGVFLILLILLHFHIDWLISATTCSALSCLSLLALVESTIVVRLLEKDPTKYIARVRYHIFYLMLSNVSLMISIMGFAAGIGYYQYIVSGYSRHYLVLYWTVMACVSPAFLPLPLFLAEYCCRVRVALRRIKDIRRNGMEWRSRGQYYVEYNEGEDGDEGSSVGSFVRKRVSGVYKAAQFLAFDAGRGKEGGDGEREDPCDVPFLVEE